jgi:uncharacterized protein (TIGR00730 family)
MDKQTITIFGSGRSQSDSQIYKLAEEIGSLLAKAGFTIANGGYGGTMLAAAQAAAQAGGEIIGVTCSAFKNSKPNNFITREIVTGSLDERLQTLIKIGDGYVVLPGGTGTLLELATVWELKNKGFLDARKKIILIGEFWRPLVKVMMLDDLRSQQQVIVADEPKQAVGFLCE